jgi:signal transduction histidine kinase
MIDEAEKSCARLVALIAELSDIGKLDSGGVTLGHERLDLFALISDVAGLVQEGRDREVSLEVRGEGCAELMGDRSRLRDAFSAVFRGILREKSGPARVVVDRRRERKDGASFALVVVADEASVQTAYEQAASPFDERRGGLGLALPLARRVIEGHGGTIWSPQPAGAPGERRGEGLPAERNDAVARGSAIVRLPITESK